MASSINTNVASLGAQRSLSTTQSALRSSMTRLSSGLRVNSAKDDAAGLAIAERMSAQVRGMNVAVRNANDAISLTQTAEGALAKVGDALQRMRELAVQSRNATNNASDRDSLHKEFGELGKEISRVIAGTTFNGKAILGADAGSMSFQVGANTGALDAISLSLQNLAAATSIAAVVGAAPPTAASLAAANAAVGPAVNAAVSALGYASEGAAVEAGYTSATSATGAAIEAVRVHALDQGFGAQIGTLTAGLSAVTSGAAAYALVLANATSDGWADPTAPATTAQAAFGAFAAIVPPASGGASIGSGQDTAGLARVINDLDAALAHVNGQRASFGATQARFESVIGSLQIGIENQSAARSRIMDADFAVETAQLSRAQIVQQAGTAMVAQANQLPRIVLRLIT